MLANASAGAGSCSNLRQAAGDARASAVAGNGCNTVTERIVGSLRPQFADELFHRAAQRGAKTPDLPMDREEQTTAALNLLNPPLVEREQCRLHVEHLLDIVGAAGKAAYHARATKRRRRDYGAALQRFYRASRNHVAAGGVLPIPLSTIERAVAFDAAWVSSLVSAVTLDQRGDSRCRVLRASHRLESKFHFNER